MSYPAMGLLVLAIGIVCGLILSSRFAGEIIGEYFFPGNYLELTFVNKDRTRTTITVRVESNYSLSERKIVNDIKGPFVTVGKVNPTEMILVYQMETWKISGWTILPFYFPLVGRVGDENIPTLKISIWHR